MVDQDIVRLHPAILGRRSKATLDRGIGARADYGPAPSSRGTETFPSLLRTKVEGVRLANLVVSQAVSFCHADSTSGPYGQSVIALCDARRWAQRRPGHKCSEGRNAKLKRQRSHGAHPTK